MKTRQDYISGKCTHREYYAQFVTPEIRQMVITRFGADLLKSALAKDENLNGVPLHQWDNLTGFPNHALAYARLKAAGDHCTLSSGVCILKEAARQVAEEGE